MGQSFINRAGTAAAIKVVCGGQRPDFLPKNTIWAQTDIPKGDVTVSAVHPLRKPDGKPFKEGDIWVSLAQPVGELFPPMQAGAMTVYPGGVWQMKEGRWCPVKAEVMTGRGFAPLGMAVGDKRIVVPEWTDPDNDLNMMFTDLVLGEGTAVDMALFKEKAVYTDYTEPTALATSSLKEATLRQYFPGKLGGTGVTLADGRVAYRTLRCTGSESQSIPYQVTYVASNNLADYNIELNSSGTTLQYRLFFVDYEKLGLPIGAEFVTGGNISGTNLTMQYIWLYFPEQDIVVHDTDLVQIKTVAYRNSVIDLSEIPDFHYGAIVMVHAGTQNTAKMKFVKKGE